MLDLGNHFGGGELFSSTSSSDSQGVGCLRRLKLIRKSIFQSNHVLLRCQPITELTFQLFLLVEFLQLLFYVLYDVEFENDINVE